MQIKELGRQGERTLVAVFAKGDEFMTGMQEVAQQYGLTSASFTGIGAFSRVTLGFFQRQTMDYKQIPIDEQTEVLALVGNIALSDGKPKIHPHVVLGKADGSAWGGHILEARIWPTLEVVITEAPATLQRRTDSETGLALLQL